MVRRHKRFDMPLQPDVALASLKVCRDAMIVLHRNLVPMGKAYNAAANVVAAIDGFAEVLTGDRRHFAIKPAPSTAGDRKGEA